VVDGLGAAARRGRISAGKGERWATRKTERGNKTGAEREKRRHGDVQDEGGKKGVPTWTAVEVSSSVGRRNSNRADGISDGKGKKKRGETHQE
jgi:hypothetical protein